MTDTCSTLDVVTASASGKLIIAGEYAVLFGWPALVCAMDRQFKISLCCVHTDATGNDISHKSPNKGPVLKINSRGMQVAQSSFALACDSNDAENAGQITVSREHHLYLFSVLFNRLVHHFGIGNLLNTCSWEITLDSSELFDSGDKLGLGSSAAMTVALDRLFFALKKRCVTAEDFAPFAEESTDQRWARLHQLHSDAQGKQGSGVDVAAGLAGAVSCFENKSHIDCAIEARSLPEGVFLAYFWSGQSASTPAFLNSLSSWKTQNPDAFEHYISSLGQASVRISRAKTAEMFLQALAEFTAELDQFDQCSQLGIFAGGHRELFDEAGQFQRLVYKPCGAGGGDLGLAVATDERALDAFTQSAEARSARRIAMHITSPIM